MTTASSMTYLVADIVGSSLIMQLDQRKGIDLFETFQSLLLPLIEKEGGSAVEYTGDAVSAAFDNCQSAVATGLAIQNVLEQWNLSAAGPGLHARIGIFSSANGSDEHQQQLSLAAATCLQSLGREDALCVSTCDIDGIDGQFPVFVFPRGKNDLGFLSEPAAVYYLYQKMPGFLSRLKLQFDYLNTDYFSQIKYVISSPLIAIPLLLVFDVLLFQLLNDSPFIGARHVEINVVQDFTEGKFDREISGLNYRLREKIGSLAERSVVQKKLYPEHRVVQEKIPSISIVSGFQHHSGRVRLNWGILQQGSSVQKSGGVITGKVENLAMLESQFIEEIISELDSKY